jgi:CRISPR-associated protein Csd1
MILQALNRYYDILAADPDSGIPLYGYSVAGVSFALVLSPQGELLDVLHLFDQVQRGKKTIEIAQRITVPEQVKRTVGITPNFLCDNSVYVLGLTNRKDAKDPNYAVNRFTAFRDFNLDLLEKVDSPPARAVSAFLKRYDPDQGSAIPALKDQLEEIYGANLVFKLAGSPGFVHDDPQVRAAWEAYKATTGNEYLGQCLVTGETAPIARLHPSLKRVYGAQSSGATLVGFNASAYESYNRARGQGLNSPVSEKAAFAYATVLNYLLSEENRNNQILIGDTTVVYWAESTNRAYTRLFTSLFGGSQEMRAGDAEEEPARDKPAELRLKDIAVRLQRGQGLDMQELLAGLNPNTRFYVLGLAPNAARVSVRFFHTDPFVKMVQKVVAHYKDLQIIKEFDNQPDLISPRQILWETVVKESSNPKSAPLLGGALFRSILTQAPYPAALYSAVINRIRAEMDDREKGTRKINYARAAILKAVLLRKYRNQPQHPIQEVLTMALNEQSTLPAYVLGRLFAVLEKAQQEAIGDVNAGIKDRYFTSACATPASVFPVLLRLSQHHISKADHGRSLDRRIQDILNLLDIEKNPIPAHLSLDEQGAFVLGYYHQRAAFFIPRANPKPVEALPAE